MLKTALLLSKIKFIRNSILEGSDLSPFKEKPDLRVYTGIFLIGFSYIIGWPLISGLGIFSIYMKEPLIIVIGGPLAYGISHLVFWIGMYLAGAKYAKIFSKWFVRVLIEKMVGNQHILYFKSQLNRKNIKPE